MDLLDRRLDNPIEFEDAVKRAVPIVIGISALYSIEAQNFLDRLRKLATSKRYDYLARNARRCSNCSTLFGSIQLYQTN